VLDLLKLKTFQVAAATSNFSRAAMELGYSQSSVTSHIQALERELGATLFDRVSRNVVLTEVGRRTLEYANRLLALAEEAKAAVHKSKDVTGSLSVSAPEALVVYRLPEVLRQFQNLYPGVHLTLASHPRAEAQIEAVLESSLDLAFMTGPRLRSDQLAVRTLGVEEILLVAAPDYRAAGGGFQLEHIADEPILLTDKNCSFRQLFEKIWCVAQPPLKNTLTMTSVEAIKQCAMAGMGLAVVPHMAVAAELKHHKLVALPWPGFELRAHVQMFRNRKRPASPPLQALWDLAERSFSGD
jgi:DNA-binding transcriptional LysR family regulator